MHILLENFCTIHIWQWICFFDWAYITRAELTELFAAILAYMVHDLQCRVFWHVSPSLAYIQNLWYCLPFSKLLRNCFFLSLCSTSVQSDTIFTWNIIYDVIGKFLALHVIKEHHIFYFFFVEKMEHVRHIIKFMNNKIHQGIMTNLGYIYIRVYWRRSQSL